MLNSTILSPFDESECRDDILQSGYAIRHDVVDVAHVAAIREHWLATFRAQSRSRPVIWGPYYGEQNRVIYDQADSLEIYRSYDFLWNPPLHPLTRQLGLDLSRVRNRIAEHDERYGEYLTDDNYGIYITTTLYPANHGWMQEHRDEVAPGERHWHFILPMTFKGEDYEAGGLYVIDRDGNRVEVDDHVRPGSVIFFDGARPHGVDKVVASKDGVGRLQMFAIPVLFEMPHEHDRLLEQVSVKRYIKSRLRGFLRDRAG